MIVLETPSYYQVGKYRIWMGEKLESEEAKRWVLAARMRAKKIQREIKTKYKYFGASNRLIKIKNGFYGYMIDLRNAYLVVAFSMGIITEKQYYYALKIRKKNNIKPAMMLGMALGGSKKINEYEGERLIRSEEIEKSTRLFPLVSDQCMILMQNLTRHFDAKAYFVDSMIFDKKPDVEKIKEFISLFLNVNIPIYIKVSRAKVKVEKGKVFVNKKYWGNIWES